MKNTNLVGLIAAPLLVFALSLPAWAADSTDPTTCKDGTTSAATGKGACSGHGGVKKAAKTATATAAPTAAAPAAPAAPAGSGSPKTCTDGTTSTATGKGACSGHGGVQKASKTKAAAAPAATSTSAAPAATMPAAASAATPAVAKTSTATKSVPTATAGNTDPTGATAKCKDGTYSKSQHHSGTCSSHGGVAEWLTAAQ
jgi:hypothetical protein